MWVTTQDLPRSAAHPFYTRLNQILDQADFDAHVETLCQQFYADDVGRPGLPPGRYFRMLLLGYFEGLDSERPIAWQASGIKTPTREDLTRHHGLLGFGAPRTFCTPHLLHPAPLAPIAPLAPLAPLAPVSPTQRLTTR